MNKLPSIIFLLTVALLIQNTCPLGAAGKTSLASSCTNCPLKHTSIASFGGQKEIVKELSIHFPLFVFAVPKTVHTFQLESITSKRPALANSYEDALPQELLRPPKA